MAAVMARMPNVGLGMSGAESCSTCCPTYSSPSFSSKSFQVRGNSGTGQGLGKYAGLKVVAFKTAVGPFKGDNSGASIGNNGILSVPQQSISSRVSSNPADNSVTTLAGQSAAGSVPVVPDINGLTTVQVEPDSSPPKVPSELEEKRSRVSLSAIMAPVADDLRILNENLQKIVGEENPLLMAAADQIFSAGGKRLRPAMVFLVSRATAALAGLDSMQPQHWRLAQVIEMIHTASLMHDDVLDESDKRRGKQTVHTMFGTRVAVLAGDFMFAQSSWYLANLDNLEVMKLISQVIKDFASGEIKQAMSLFDPDLTMQDYLDKSCYKTASLIAASTKAAAIFSGVSQTVCDKMYDYGLQLGLAFQIVDDILDFTQTSEQLGKPAGSDLAKGNLTAPVLYALEKEPELRDLIAGEFSEEGSLEAAIGLVVRGGGIEKARQLARERGDLALKDLECLPQGSVRQSLEDMVQYVLDRAY
ncbi:hypothetical protein R1sor_000790 [Riccia sorocarpa]|uniref:Solanesyl diphosphate synthase n=1 Tax=Riccia sorocarpa TaxID=122646 RepID=A0ABD3GUE4_9MARC